MGISNALKKLDAFSKIDPKVDIEVRTYEGAALTILSTLIMITLIISELNAYLSPNLQEELFVDTTRGHKLKINLDIYIPKIHCNYLSLDAMDSGGEQHLHIEHSIYKRRMTLDGTPIEEPKKEDIQTTTKIISKKANITTEDKPEDIKCGSCYGAQLNDTHCCNTCQDVIDAYREKRWNPNVNDFVQCQKERKLTGEAEQHAFDEGCQIYGNMEVNRMGGSFHVAPGKSFSINHVHVHDVQPFSSSKFNTSHTINHLSFGEQINFGDTHPLDHLEFTAKEGAIMFQYYIKIVPTMYVPKEGPILHTNQFSVTTHQKLATAISGESGMPGVFFSYELSPLMVKFTERSNSFGHFATNVCAIIGGIFTVAGLLDSVLHSSIKAIKRKIELGKFN